jgi:hypothetical protein
MSSSWVCVAVGPFPGTPAITPKADGTFTIGPVRAGEYVIAAVTGMSMASLFEPSARAEIAERIAKGGERLVLVENDKHSIDLRSCSNERFTDTVWLLGTRNHWPLRNGSQQTVVRV